MGFIKNIFTVTSGALNITSEKLLTMNEGTIRAVFKQSTKNLIKTHKRLKTNLTNILIIVEEKRDSLKSLEKQLKKVKEKSNNSTNKTVLSGLKTKKTNLEDSIENHKLFLEKNDNIKEKYVNNLLKIQNKIDEIEMTEEQTISDISLAKSTMEIKKLSKLDVSANYNNDTLAIVEKARKRAMIALRVEEDLEEIEKDLEI